MSFSKQSKRDVSTAQRNRSGSSIQKKRETEKRRREQQCIKQELAADVPVFSQPKKTTRQDSLTRNINNVLGDSGVVSGILFREPNIWLGTSRTGQGQQPSSGSKQAVGNVAKEHSIAAVHKTDPSHQPLDTDGDSQMPAASQVLKSRKEGNVYTMQQKQSQQACPRQSDSFVKAEIQDPQPKFNNALPSPPSVHESEDFVHSAVLATERDRISSIDSDILGGVENILKEMVELPPSLTAIKTPIVNENKFNFTDSVPRRKLDGPKSTLETAALGAGAASDGESSCDESSDEEDNWNLGSLMEQSQPSNSSLDNSTISNSLKACSKSEREAAPHNTMSTSEYSTLGNVKPSTHVSGSATSCNSLSQSHTRNDKTDSHNVSFNKGLGQQMDERVEDDLNSAISSSCDRAVHRRNSKPKSGKDLAGGENARLRTGRQSDAPGDRIDNSVGTREGVKNENHHKSWSMPPVKGVQSHASSSSHGRNPDRALLSQSLNDYVPEATAQSHNRTSGFSASHQRKTKHGRPKKNDTGWSLKNGNASRKDLNTSMNNSHNCASEDEFENSRSSGRTHNPGSNCVKRDHPPPFGSSPRSKNGILAPKSENERVKPSQRELFLRQSLWVRFKASLLCDAVKSPENPPNHSEINRHSPDRRMSVRNERVTTSLQQHRTGLIAVSTGSETEQPVRRANCVQVAVADGSTDWTDKFSSTCKRKHEFSENPCDSLYCKRQRRERPYQGQVVKPNASLLGSDSFSQQNKPFQCREGGEDGTHTGYCCQTSEPIVDSIADKRASSSMAMQASPSSYNASRTVSTVVLPDSSVPGEQERIQTSDGYMREGKKKKHDGDGMVDSRTGRTRPGEALGRALSYFEASLFFIMSGYVMETENPEETGTNGSSNTLHCPTNMYQQTIPLLDFILKMRPRLDPEDKIVKRIAISCLRCQAYLYFRIFKLKKDTAVKYSELLTEQFKIMGKSNRVSSPWHNTNAAPNVLSPMSPAVPSPFGHRGPSPASNNGEQVSSSTPTGKMTPPTNSGYSFSQKTFDLYRHHHTIMSNLLQAHEKWDQGENMLEEHIDFFRNIDTLCNRTLTFHSTLRDVFLYYKMVLYQLRTLITDSTST